MKGFTRFISPPLIVTFVSLTSSESLSTKRRCSAFCYFNVLFAQLIAKWPFVWALCAAPYREEHELSSIVKQMGWGFVPIEKMRIPKITLINIKGYSFTMFMENKLKFSINLRQIELGQLTTWTSLRLELNSKTWLLALTCICQVFLLFLFRPLPSPQFFLPSCEGYGSNASLWLKKIEW
jgi:hypothetical protein